MSHLILILVLFTGVAAASDAKPNPWRDEGYWSVRAELVNSFQRRQVAIDRLRANGDVRSADKHQKRLDADQARFRAFLGKRREDSRWSVNIEQGQFRIGFRPQRVNMPVDIADGVQYLSGVTRMTPGFQY